jgi:hypothetical protein
MATQAYSATEEEFEFCQRYGAFAESLAIARDRGDSIADTKRTAPSLAKKYDMVNPMYGIDVKEFYNLIDVVYKKRYIPHDYIRLIVMRGCIRGVDEED